MPTLDFARKLDARADRDAIRGARRIPTFEKRKDHTSMSRTASPHRLVAFPIAVPGAESAAQRTYAAESGDDSVSALIIEREDEYGEAAIIVEPLNRGLH